MSIPTCSFCGKSVRLGARFCPYCGNAVLTFSTPQSYAPPLLPGETCPACAFVNRAGARFCKRCGTSLIAAPALPPVIDIPPPTPAYPDPVVQFKVNSEGRFGLKTTLGDPERDDDDNKKLTFSEDGSTNNTRVYVDGDTPVFGSSAGKMVTKPGTVDGVSTTAWEYHRILVTQRLEIVLGSSTNLFDTLRIEYTLENRDTKTHRVGLRIMLDTYIGDNDGVPFAVPGKAGITDRAVDLRGEQIPDFFQVLERPNLDRPGVVVNVTLASGDATPPERVLITGWPGSDAPWDYLKKTGGVGAKFKNYLNGNDSAVGLFYPIEALAPGEQRLIVAYYGLGAISSVATQNTQLGLSVSANRVEAGRSFWLVARISAPRQGQRVRVKLPPVFKLVEGEEVQPLAPEANANFTTRSWYIRALTLTDRAEIVVTLEPDNVRERQAITIVPRAR